MATNENLFGALNVEETQRAILALLDMAVDRLGVLGAARGIDNSLRVSGAVSVGTVTTLTNQAQTGGFPTQQILPATRNIAAQANIDCIAVS